MKKLWFIAACAVLLLKVGAFEKKFAPEHKLQGTGEFIPLMDDYKVDTLKGASYVMTARYFPERKSRNYQFGTIFYKHGEFIFALRNRKLYFIPSNAGNGNWNYTYFTGGIHAEEMLPEGDSGLHHFVLTLSRYVEVEQGTDYTDVKLYMDGALVGGRRFDHYVWRDAGSKLVAGGVDQSNSTFESKCWSFAGDVDNIKVFDRALTDDEIQNMVKADKRLKPNFQMPVELSRQEVEALTPAKNAPKETKALLSALSNAAKLGRIDWRKCYSRRAESAITLKGKESSITILNDGSRAALTSFYDHKADREILAWNNPFFEISCFNERGREFRVVGSDPSLSCKLVEAPELKDGTWYFAFAGKHSASERVPFTFDYKMKFRFVDDRLEFTMEAANTSDDCRLGTVRFPAFRTNTFKDGNDTLLVPCMSGVIYKDAASIGANYFENYPRGRSSLQMGAYYDDRGGIMFATADPRARAKSPTFAVGREISGFGFIWTVPFRKKLERNTFKPGCYSTLTLFRGDWYDAGLAYRQMIERLNPPWWRKDLPNTDCPQWFRDNTIWFGRWLDYKNYANWLRELDHLKRWKEYVGAPGQAVHFYEWCLHFTRDWPHNPASPDFVDRTRAMKDAGYRVVPYINARIWEDKDKRDTDYRFSRFGLPAALINSVGKPSPEPYAPFMFYVICPGTETYEKEMFRECNNCVIYGADGAYLDQIGAGTHIPCYSTEHGHLCADPDLWYMQGHRKVFTKLRKYWQKHYPEAITFGEDIAETTVDVLDGGLTWRWMYDGQVGLFPLVYSGRTQMAGISWAGSKRIRDTDKESIPAKLTFQLFNGCQLGWFSIGYVVQPSLGEFRPFIKQYAHLRHAMLEFFNRGMMARPPRFRKRQQDVSHYWGEQGSKTITSAPLQACAWRVDGITAILCANTDPSGVENILECGDLPKGTLHIFHSSGKRETKAFSGGKLEMPVNPGYKEFFAVLAVPEGSNGGKLLKGFEEAFEVIAAANNEKDPWSTEK